MAQENEREAMKAHVFCCANCGASLEGKPGQSIDCGYCEARNHLSDTSAHDRIIRIQHELLKTRKEREAKAEALMEEYIALQTSYLMGQKSPELRAKILFTYERFLRLMQVHARKMYAGQEGEFYRDALIDLEEQVQDQLAKITEVLDRA